MSRQQEAKERSERLGAVLKKLRTQKKLTFDKVYARTGLGKSYLSYLEQGKYSDVGLDKFARLLEVLESPADRVLVEAGYLTKTTVEKQDLRSFLQTRLDLSPEDLEHAMNYLTFLSQQSKKKKGAKT